MNFHKILDNHLFYKRFLSEASKSGFIFFSPQGEEISEESTDQYWKTPKREGISSVDIYGYWLPSFLEYFKGNMDAYMEGVEVYLESLPKRNILKKIIAYVKAINFLELKIPWMSWVWVIDSLDSFRYDIVRENLKKVSKKERLNQDFNLLCSKVSREELFIYVNENYARISPNLWVSREDPGVIVYNNYEEGKPYGLKDGWTFHQLAEILSEWAFFMSGKQIKAKLKKE